MPTRIASALAANPELAEQLYMLASEIVDDFEDFGPVLQANDAGEYDDSTTIARLKTVRDQLITQARSRVVASVEHHTRREAK